MANLPPTALAATSLTFGLSDLQLIEQNRHWGPSLRFTLTLVIDLANGLVYAQSTPGFRYMRLAGGEYAVRAPLRTVTANMTIYATQISTDFARAIQAELDAQGWRRKVGANNPVESLLLVEGNLLSEEKSDVHK